MRLGHISDTHIMLTKYHDEYREVFNKIYVTLRAEKVDYIIHTGDLFHSKLQLSPEAVTLAVDFLKNLSDIAPVYIIAGNHDTNLRNNTRLDSITPIVDAISSDRVTYLRKSGEYKLNDEATLNVLSIFDEAGWVKPSDPTKINIALYHGCIAGSKTDAEYVLKEGDHDISIFEGHDYALLGDIHRANQELDTEGRVTYAGSTTQQNFGDYDNKGILIWDIINKQAFNKKHYAYPNPKPFITVILSEDGSLPVKHIKKNARVRVIAEHNIPLDKIRKSIDIIKTSFKPDSVTFVNKAKLSKSIDKDGTLLNENLRDYAVQEKLMREFLSEYNVEEAVMQKVFELNKRFSKQIEETEEVSRNVKWNIKSLEWDNLFNYGEGNRINFDNLSGVVGIFGKNFSGKSSIIDSLLYSIFNTTSKNNRKNLNVINQQRERGRGKVEVDINGTSYIIDRVSEKYSRKSKGQDIVEAKTDVTFTSNNQDLTGTERNDTDKVIRKYFGTVDDFFLTSMSTQFGYLNFLSEGSTKRKEILAKFLDLDIFEKKHKLAKEESATTKAILKKYDGQDYIKLISAARSENIKIEEDITSQQILLVEEGKKLQDLTSKKEELEKQLSNLPSDISEYPKIVEKIRKLKISLQESEETLQNLNKSIEDYTEKLVKIDEFLANFDEKKLQDSKKDGETIDKKRQIKLVELFELQSKDAGITKRTKLLGEVPCGTEFSHCKFIKDAWDAKNSAESVKDSLVSIEKELEKLKNEYDKVGYDAAISNLQKITALQKKKLELSSLKLNALSDKSKLDGVISSSKTALESLEAQERRYKDNLELISNYDSTRILVQQSTKAVDEQKNYIKIQNNILSKLFEQRGSSQERLNSLLKEQGEVEQLRKEYSAYDLFLKCMHSNGISYEIIKNKLPQINTEIEKTLASIVDFTIFFDNDDDKLDIMIKHPAYEARPLEMGSGAEKTLGATAIRLALLNITSLPKSDIFVLDEPGTALDDENLEGFIKILDMVKQHFRVVFLISHLDKLKESVDMQITIDKIGGFANVSV
jgi:DNA repair exonuclease SbcCD ATPase subunit/DNA repair exonuclease SbcCD nuclease subunit